VAELRELVTRARVATVMTEAGTTWAEKMAQERAIRLATAYREADMVARRVSILGGELVTMRRAWDVAVEKLPCLAAKAAATNQLLVVVEEQCERLVHELTLLNLRGSTLCMTITGAPLQAPLHEGMRFAAIHHTEVIIRLCTLYVVVSLASQSILGCLPIDVSQAGVVGEMVARF
jgi:hypothetical protein